MDDVSLLVLKGMGQFYAYVSLFLDSASESERLQVFSDAVDWLESRAETKLEPAFKTRVFSAICTPEGNELLRWLHEGAKP